MLFQNTSSISKATVFPECGSCPVGRREPAKVEWTKADIVVVADTLTTYRHNGINATEAAHLFKGTQIVPAMACDLRYGENRWKQSYCTTSGADKSKGATCCKPRFEAAMRAINPKVIIVAGPAASTAVIRPDYSPYNSGKFSEIAFTWLKSAYWKAHVICVPELEVFDDKKIPEAYYDCLVKAVAEANAMTKEPRPVPPAEDFTVTTGLQTVKYINDLCKVKGMISYDYETNGIQPYDGGYFIRSCSCYWGVGSPNSFLLYGDEHEGAIFEAWKKFLVSPTRKIAQNMKYEYQFAKMTLGVETRGLVFDPMIAAHVLDNRSMTKGLKWLSYRYLGAPEYTDVVGKFLYSKSGERKNKILECPVAPLLKYNALDARYTWLIAKEQMKELKVKHED